MEPITIATAFASIIGLIRIYKTEAQEYEEQNFDQYMDWLRRQEHKQLVDVILGSDDLARSVRDLVLRQANAGGVRHGCSIEMSDDTVSSQRWQRWGEVSVCFVFHSGLGCTRCG